MINKIGDELSLGNSVSDNLNLKSIHIQNEEEYCVYIFDSDEEIGVFITMLEKLKSE